MNIAWRKSNLSQNKYGQSICIAQSKKLRSSKEEKTNVWKKIFAVLSPWGI